MQSKQQRLQVKIKIHYSMMTMAISLVREISNLTKNQKKKPKKKQKKKPTKQQKKKPTKK